MSLDRCFDQIFSDNQHEAEAIEIIISRAHFIQFVKVEELRQCFDVLMKHCNIRIPADKDNEG
jgi:glutaredoxin-related protein